MVNKDNSDINQWWRKYSDPLLKAAQWNFSFCVDFGGPCGQRR